MEEEDVRVVIVASDVVSGFGPSWTEVLEHIGQRLKWSNPRFVPFVLETMDVHRLREARPDAVLLIGVDDAAVDETFLEAMQELCPKLVLCFENASPRLDSVVSLNGFHPTAPSLKDRLHLLLPWSSVKKSEQIYDALLTAWSRQTSDDIVYLIQFAVHHFVTELPEMTDLTPDLDAIRCIGTHCRERVLQCLLDPQCRKALDCINSCGMNDQVCSYRCIASYESKLLEDFSLCILQKHNCLRQSASIPLLPEVRPLTSFRDEPLTFQTAEDIFIGHLDTLGWSWKVACGKNPAYDYFPCQFQLFYRGRSKGSMWYDPVFSVITLDGRRVWRKRHYRVRRGKQPGTFFFSVLDNGVTSNEYWRIVEVDDELRWALFFYSGAAAAAGIAYTGAVLGTPDGRRPMESEMPRVEGALERCGIKSWEISNVDYTCCENPPLEIPHNLKR